MALRETLMNFTNVLSAIEIGASSNTSILRNASQAAKDSLIYGVSPILIKNDFMRMKSLANSEVNREAFIKRRNLYGEIHFGSMLGEDANIGQTHINNNVSINVNFGHTSNGKQNQSYNELDRKSSYSVNSYDSSDKNAFMYGSSYNQIAESESYDLLSYTNNIFHKSKEETLTETLIGRFHTNNSKGQAVPEWWQSKTEYGLSRGRNLLKIKPTTEGGYDNPYCRVWTYHHRYSQVGDLIRPFYSDELKGILGGGYEYLRRNDVKFDNGLVRFAPTSNKDGLLPKDEIKRCMFSIENLAWKNDRNKLPDSQKGDIGRIMWFPPYDLSFDENVSVNWSGNDFIGRGEKIYSYVDTERSGSLKFKILIDHPRIVDRYAKHYKYDGSDGNVDENLKGNTIGPNGTVHGSDSKYRSAEYSLLRFFAGCQIIDPKDKPLMELSQPNKIDKTPSTQPEPSKTNKIVFFVYYPNNYSGVDDWRGSIVDPISYLVNGVSSQKEINGEDFENIKDIQIDDLCFPLWKKNDSEDTIGGYQVRGRGITVNPTGSGARSVDGLFVKRTMLNEQVESRTTILHLGNQKTSNNATHNPDKTVKYWGYRVDEACSGQRFKTFSNYEDGNSDLKLNSDVSTTTGDTSSIWHISENSKEEGITYVSLTDMYASLCGDNVKKVLDGFYNEENVKKIVDILSHYKVTNIHSVGHASVHGSKVKENGKDMNTILAENRAYTPLKWLQKYKAFSDVETKVDTFSTQTEQLKADVDEMKARMWRSTKVEIEFDVSENTGLEAEGKYTETFNKKIDVNNTQETNKEELQNTEQGQTADEVTQTTETGDKNAKDDANGDESDKIDGSDTITNDKDGNAEPSSKYDTHWTENDDEYEYFKKLEHENPFVYSKVIEKVKYFSPAYHSITPEGFNERLTFLHQCTRQGPTSSYSDNDGHFANNISFGPPPVCILRIGDFYNTRVIFESMSITYDDNGIQWDLNDEGIGVMPMTATIQLQFKFIGGSDLSGPISRLQNAVSHNYYANTSVYNKNSERWSKELEDTVNTTLYVGELVDNSNKKTN